TQRSVVQEAPSSHARGVATHVPWTQVSVVQRSPSLQTMRERWQTPTSHVSVEHASPSSQSAFVSHRCTSATRQLSIATVWLPSPPPLAGCETARKNPTSILGAPVEKLSTCCGPLTCTKDSTVRPVPLVCVQSRSGVVPRLAMNVLPFWRRAGPVACPPPPPAMSL